MEAYIGLLRLLAGKTRGSRSTRNSLSDDGAITPESSPSPTGLSVLHDAVRDNDVSSLKAGLVKAQLGQGNSPMMSVFRQACELDRPDVVELCLELGVDVLLPMDENGGNCWHVACMHDNVATVERLGQKCNRAKRSKALQNNDSNGFTPLVWCCRQGKAELIRALLSLGVDVNLEAANGMHATRSVILAVTCLNMFVMS